MEIGFIFFEGLTPKDRQMVELICNGSFEDKNPNEVMEYLDSLVGNAKNWDTTSTYGHRVKFNLIHLVEVCTTLGKIMTSKPNFHL